MTRRLSTAAPILAMLAVVAVSLAVYVAGYYWLGNVVEIKFGSKERLRCYPYSWEASIFAPLGHIESEVLRRDVVAVYERLGEDGIREFAVPGR